MTIETTINTDARPSAPAVRITVDVDGARVAASTVSQLADKHGLSDPGVRSIIRRAGLTPIATEPLRLYGTKAFAAAVKAQATRTGRGPGRPARGVVRGDA